MRPFRRRWGDDLYLVSMNLVVPVKYRGQRSSAALRGMIWSNVDRADRVEHVYARAGPERVQVVLFVQAATRHEADITAYRVCARACARMPGAYPDT